MAVRALSGCINLFNQSADLLHMYLKSMMYLLKQINKTKLNMKAV